MELLRCHNMIPAHVKWYVSQWKGATETWLFGGTRKQCEDFIRLNSPLATLRTIEASKP